MNARTLGGLIAVNAALLIGLAVASFSGTPSARAQAARPGDYTMIAGNVAGRNNQQVVYVIETQTSRVVALLYSSANNSVEVLDGRVIGTDLTAGRGARP